MPLTSGTKLGPYEIISPLGAGGMGEVYRARDTRLDRTVAIKVLPQHLADTPDAKQRFEREARAVSALNHPNICTLFDVGSQDGTEFLVMEYLEGETLAARLDKGALPLDQSLKIAIDIADALDKAHRQGIIHRDLKPGNIMLTKSGAKLLDFGLAIASLPLVTDATLTSAAARTSPITQAGMVVGTFQYMSPEQVEGKNLDPRSDLFSFGSVLYEMLTGRAAFQGRSQLSVASAILEKDPEPISTLQPMTPPALDRTVRKCLAKDPEDRWQTARDLLLELKWISGAGSQAGVPIPIVAHRKVRERIAWAVASALAVIGIALAIGFAQRAPKPAQSINVTSELGADATLITADDAASAILSPDGTRLAFVARAAGADRRQLLYIRSLNQLQATALSGTDDAHDPFFSPDSQWIAFFADDKLKKISVQGGAAVTLCGTSLEHGGSWDDDSTIIFSRGTLFKVSSTGGTPERRLTTLNHEAGEVSHRYPQILPGGKAVLFTSNTNNINFEDASIVVYSMETGKYKTVHRGGYYARYLPSGHLVYIHEGALFAAPFDLKHLEVTGPAVSVIERIKSDYRRGASQFSFSETGSFAYVASADTTDKVSISWMDAAGEFTPLRETPGEYDNPALSPDGKRLAMEISDGQRPNIWVYDLERTTLARLTTTNGRSRFPVWTPDGQRIAYHSIEDDGTDGIYWKRADGAGDAQRLTESSKNQQTIPQSWHRDGKTLAFSQRNAQNNHGLHIWTVSVEGSEKTGWKAGQPKPFLSDTFQTVDPAFSPDGRWIAYTSGEAGKRNEIYVRPFPGPGGKWPISTDGGSNPVWSRNGKELFYSTLSRDQIMVANYTASGGTFRPEKPRLWSPGQFATQGGDRTYDLAHDGKRFVVLKKLSEGVAAPPIDKVTFIFNFFDELRRKVPAGQN